jgi:CDP-4-dehydro-6-deoxyglucose reductase, E3
MSFKVTIHSNQSSFDVNSDETVLDAALNQGVNLPYGCRSGFCGECKGKIINGQVSYQEQPANLSEEDQVQGYAFLCSCKPESNLEIDIELVVETSSIEIKTMPCRIQSMQKVADDVLILSLKLPAEEGLQFLPGQYIDILLENGKKRSFSLANPPHNDGFMELHVRHVPGGIFTDQLFSTIKEMDILRIEGPHGNFFYREATERPIILVAGGTGFAPIKSIIEHLIEEKMMLPIYLYWGVRTQADLYMDELAAKWQQDFPNIQYVPVLSEAKNDQQWNGKTGFVHQSVCDDFNDLSSYDIYACGPPIMTTSAEQAFKKKGLKEGHFFSDSFDYAEQAGN